MSIAHEEDPTLPSTSTEATPQPKGPIRKRVVLVKDEEDEEDDEQQGRRVFLGNLPDSSSRKDVVDFLGEWMKKVTLVKLARDRKDRQSFKGYAFVTFKKKAQAEEAVKFFNDKYWRHGEDKNDRSRKVNAQISPFFTGKGKCFWCGSTEHTKDKCTKDVSGHAGSTCYRCGQSGHIVKDCPKVADVKTRKREREEQQVEQKKQWEEMKKQPGFVYPPSKKEKAEMEKRQLEEEAAAKEAEEPPKKQRKLTLGEQSRLKRASGQNTVWVNPEAKKKWW
eukprot:TRINITY_DN4894_c0_g1_i1.p1 TRINITY_DN4894_c0_g1~~TRINITY_DN4894_c0_g1_i1.p1  ORF type:complete len:278 (+),score=74.18 TRINITY_DN4894_c0_g1_i1:888-1721(+)